MARHGHINAIRLTAQGVVLVLKRHSARARLDPEHAIGRSLRADPATSTAAAGVHERVLAEQTGYMGTAMLRRYMCESSLFRQDAAGATGL